jgi:hypothetical protein
MDARSVADVPEHELVELLVNDQLLRSMTLSATGSNSATPIFPMKHDFVL